jgi:hypothetical protein
MVVLTEVHGALIEVLVIHGKRKVVERGARRTLDHTVGHGAAAQQLLQEGREAALALAGEDVVDPSPKREHALGHLSLAVRTSDDSRDLWIDLLAPVQQRDTRRDLFERARCPDDLRSNGPYDLPESPKPWLDRADTIHERRLDVR